MSQALTKTEKKADPIATVRGLLERSHGEIVKALPKHLTPERMMRTALTCIQKTPGLLECHPTSLIGCVMQASEMGLELSGPLGQAYMVPRYNKNIRGKEACFQVGYRGFQALAFRSEKVSAFPAHVVRQKDYFSFEYGTNEHLVHRPSLDADPGPVIAAYAMLVMRDGSKDFEVMSRDQLDAHYKRYVPSTMVWNEFNMEEWQKKTVIRRLAKRSPVSIEVQRAAALDEYGEAGVDQQLPSTAEATMSRMDMLKHQLGAIEARAEETEQQAAGLDGDPEPGTEREPGIDPED